MHVSSLPHLFILTILATFFPILASAAEYSIRITPEGYAPARLTIQKGDRITFMNEDSVPHWIASDIHPTHTLYPGSDIRNCGNDAAETAFDSCRGIAPGESYAFTFNHVGTWNYHDHLDSKLTGTIAVEGTPTETSAADQRLPFAGRFKAWLLRHYFNLFKNSGDQKLHQLNLLEITRDDADLEFWMRVFGYRAIFDELVRDADDPAQRVQNSRAQTEVGECHTEAHFAGRMTYLVFGIDALEENVLDTRCAFGFYHGIVEMSLGTIGSDAIIQEFAEMCETHAEEPLRRAFCAHAIGHGLVVQYDYDLPTAIQKCTDLTRSLPARRMCYHGAFMENAFAAVGIGIRTHATKWSDRTRPDFPCDSEPISEDPYVREMCYADQSIVLWMNLRRIDAQVAVDACMRAQEDSRTMCFIGMGFNLAFAMGTHTLREDEIIAKCGAAPDTYVQQCLLGAMMMRSTHFGASDGFRIPSLCAALGYADLDACHAHVTEEFSWLRGS